MNAYMKYKTARAIGDAAQQEGGGGTVGAGMGLGMGAGLGAMLPGMMREAMQGGAAAPAQPAAAVPAAAAGSPMAEKLRQLKGLLDEGLISQEEFNAKRQKLLDEM
jgi:membrane protease subunit (stomatin/prohibitin family)